MKPDDEPTGCSERGTALLFAAGELGPEAAARFRRHREGCAECRRELADLRAVEVAYAGLERPTLGAGRLRRAVERAAWPREVRRRPSRRAVLALAAAAAVALVAAGLLLRRASPPAGTFDRLAALYDSAPAAEAPDGSLPKLARSDPSPNVRLAAIDRLWLESPANRLSAGLVQRLRDEPVPAVRMALVDLLARDPGPEVRQAIAAAASGDPDPGVRRRAAAAVGGEAP